MYIKDFLANGHPFCFGDILDSFEKFLNYFTIKTAECEMILAKMVCWREQLQDQWQSLKKEFNEISNLKEKIKVGQTKSLAKLFEGYFYHSPKELYQNIRCKEDVEKMLESLDELDSFRLADIPAFFAKQFDQFNFTIHGTSTEKNCRNERKTVVAEGGIHQ